MKPNLPVESAPSWRRLDGVDLWRGMAILFVLMNHVNMRLLIGDIPYGEALPKLVLNALVWNGQRGVQIFFAVSGFLITSTSLRRWGTLSEVRVRDFYILRSARIAPLLLVLLSILSILHGLHLENFVVPARTGGLGRALLAALTFHINVLEANRGYLPGNWDVLWSLSVEETFYFFFPLVCWLLGRGKLLMVFLSVFAVLGPFARTIFADQNEVWREVSYLGGMDAIALGCLTAILLPRLRFAPRTLKYIQLVGAMIMIWILLVPNRTLERAGLGMTFLALGTCMVIMAVAQTRRRGLWIARPVLWLGQRSYEVYLTHMFVVLGLFRLFLSFGKPPEAIPLLFIAVVLFSGVLGEVVARFFSEPMNRLLRERWGQGSNRLNSVVDGPYRVPTGD